MKSPAIQRKPSQELVPVEPEDDEMQLPDFMRADSGHTFGLEALDNTDMGIPRIKVMQGLSPEKEQFSFLKTGDFFHTAHEIALPQPLLATVIFIDKRYILWRPRDMGGGILARANDAKHWFPANQTFQIKLDKKDGGADVVWATKSTVKESGLDQWGSMDPNNPESQPAATLMYNLLLAFPDDTNLSPAILSLQRTGIKAAQKLNLKLKALNRPTFQSVLRFTTFLDHAGANAFYSVNTELAGRLVTKRQWREDDTEAWTLGTQKLYEDYKALYSTVSQSGLDIRDEASLQGDILDGLGTDPVGVSF